MAGLRGNGAKQMCKKIYKRKKKSLAVMAIYDASGVIDDYIVYYLNALRKVADRIVVAVNGGTNVEGQNRLRGMADNVLIRPNRGFDFGAYKDVLEKCFSDGILDDYQEIILCNDTCFGPFIAFETIFHVMDQRNLEFWSINYRDNLLIPYYESYFMVFSGKALGLLESFLTDIVDGSIDEIAKAQGYEHSLSESIMQQEILAGYYTSGQEQYPNLDIYKAPDYVIRDFNLPFLKKRCFSPKIMEKDNCYAALDYIRKNTDYPIDYILNSVRRNYGLNISIEDLSVLCKTVPHSFWKFYISRDELISFCRQHKKVYVYGKGYMSIFILAHFGRYMDEFGGYIVSDAHYVQELEIDEKVYPLSAIDKDTPIIVALLAKNAKEVSSQLKGWKNAVFLSISEDKKDGEEEHT